MSALLHFEAMLVVKIVAASLEKILIGWEIIKYVIPWEG